MLFSKKIVAGSVVCFSFVGTASQSVVNAVPQKGINHTSDLRVHTQSIGFPFKISDKLLKRFLTTCGIVLFLAFISYVFYRFYRFYIKDSEILAGSECKNAYASLQSDSDIFDYCFGDELKEKPEYSDVNKDIIGFGEIVKEKLSSIEANIKIQLTGKQCLKYFKKVIINAKKVKNDRQISEKDLETYVNKDIFESDNSGTEMLLDSKKQQACVVKCKGFLSVNCMFGWLYDLPNDTAKIIAFYNRILQGYSEILGNKFKLTMSYIPQQNKVVVEKFSVDGTYLSGFTLSSDCDQNSREFEKLLSFNNSASSGDVDASQHLNGN